MQVDLETLKERFFKDVRPFIRAIKARDFEGLALLPANRDFRDFNIFLSRMRHSRSRLKKALKSVNSDYDQIILDCPPDISRLSENVFRVSGRVVVPVIPTTRSERTLEQLYAFFKANDDLRKKSTPGFSMVRKNKKLHLEAMKRMLTSHKRFLKNTIPFSSDIEKMDIHRAPALSYVGYKSAACAYEDVRTELKEVI